MKMTDGEFKLFLSHKMRGKNEFEITKMRNEARQYIVAKHGICSIKIIDNYHHYEAPKNAGRLWHLGRSIQQMENADAIYFCKGWWKAKGCWIERIIAIIYKLRVLR